MKDDNNLDKTLKDIEIEELLKSVKSGQFSNDALKEENDILRPPEPSISQSKPTPDTKPKTGKNKKDTKPKSDKKAKKPKKKPKKPNKFLAKIKALPKKVKIIVSAVILAAILIGIIIGIISYAQTAYLKPYEKKYGIEFPKGIAEEFCDEYAQNDNLEGRLVITDTGSEIPICSSYEVIAPHAEVGTKLISNQQFKSIYLSKEYADLENAYKNADSYTDSTQEVKFTNIYGDSTTYQVIGAYYVTTRSQDDNDYLFMYNLYGDLTEDSFDDYEDRINSRLLYRTEYNLSYLDNFLTLSVESDFMSGFRFVVLCRQVDADIVPYTDVKINEKVHYPQVWYDVNKKENTYRFASKWYPTIYTDEEHKNTAVLK